MPTTITRKILNTLPSNQFDGFLLLQARTEAHPAGEGFGVEFLPWPSRSGAFSGLLGLHLDKFPPLLSGRKCDVLLGVRRILITDAKMLTLL
jgi:hypothetical protein